MNPLDAREADETYEYPARPYTLPMRPVQRFKVLSESGDVPTAQATETDRDQPVTSWTPRPHRSEDDPDYTLSHDGYIRLENEAIARMLLADAWEDKPNPLLTKLYDREDMTLEAWSDKYLTAEDARVLRQDGV